MKQSRPILINLSLHCSNCSSTKCYFKNYSCSRPWQPLIQWYIIIPQVHNV